MQHWICNTIYKKSAKVYWFQSYDDNTRDAIWLEAENGANYTVSVIAEHMMDYTISI